MTDPVKSSRVYWFVFLALIALTILTVAQSRLDIGHTTNRILGLAIAVTKGSLVVLFFMHLKYERKHFFPVILFPLVLVLVILFANMPDVAFGGMEGHTTPGEEIHRDGGGH